MTADERRAWSDLRHDIGKYLVRAASNIRPGQPCPDELVPLLICDLFGSPGDPRPSERFRQACPPGHELRAEIIALFSQMDALEDEVRAGDAAAVDRAAVIARKIDGALRRAAASDDDRADETRADRDG